MSQCKCSINQSLDQTGPPPVPRVPGLSLLDPELGWGCSPAFAAPRPRSAAYQPGTRAVCVCPAQGLSPRKPLVNSSGSGKRQPVGCTGGGGGEGIGFGVERLAGTQPNGS